MDSKYRANAGEKLGIPAIIEKGENEQSEGDERSESVQLGVWGRVKTITFFVNWKPFTEHLSIIFNSK